MAVIALFGAGGKMGIRHGTNLKKAGADVRPVCPLSNDLEQPR